MPYRPMGPWMDGCVPDSIRYVPGGGVVQVSAVVAPAATSVENDCTRVPCVGGVPTPVSGVPGALPAMGHVSGWALLWSGAAVLLAVVPSPPPNCPTITIEVGTGLAVVLPVGVNDRLFVRLIVRLCPVGTVITTGDQMAGVIAAGFSGAQVAVEPVTAAPQLYPHIGTAVPSGRIAVAGPAVR